MNSVTIWTVALCAAAVGILLCWLLMRTRQTAVVAAALHPLQVDAAAAQERIRGLDAERETALREIEELRAGLDRARNDAAALKERADQVPRLSEDLAGLRSSILAANSDKSSFEAEAKRVPQLTEQLDEARRSISELNRQIATLNVDLAAARRDLEAEQRVAPDKLALLAGAQETLANQFKSLANDILEEKSKRFTEQNQANLGQLLDPLRLKITEFQAKVEHGYVQEGKDRSALAEQVRQLMELNNRLSDEANNLTKALKGSSKTQGSWGELVLERVLEASGLRKDEEYIVQGSHTREDGSRAQPDVVIRLPEERNLVVDAKVSLTAYEEFASSDDETIRTAALKRHLDSVKAHIRGLSDKNYQSLYGIQSLDCVLMFVPIEPAFMLAVTSDRELFMEAWNRNVLLVSPSTLLFVVRTVAHLWRQEAQNRNAQEIAKRGGELYDKFVGFVEDLTRLGTRLTQAQAEYEQAFNKLNSGRGHLIGQAERLKALGVKPTKSLAQGLVDDATDDDGPLPVDLNESDKIAPSAAALATLDGRGSRS
jgi:DNA recombination protein RmuC